ncbi:MAG: hypothetical protein AABY07_06230 [Nanoarchaeota archaeon]
MLKDYERIELELNYLAYQRYVSRAHTIFSTCAEVVLTVVFGTIGIVISLVEIGYISEFNKFYFLRTILYSSLVIVFILLLAFYKWYKSRIIRSKIIKQIQSIQKKV